MNLGSRDTFICPRCGHEWEEPLPVSDYEERCDNYYCPECGFDSISIELQTDYWYEQSLSTFAEQYLRLRGYDGNPKSWYTVGCYVEHFLDGRRQKVEQWKDEQWIEAYDIVQTYFDRDPCFEKVRCTGCGKEHPVEDSFSSDMNSSQKFTIRCPDCGKPEDRYMVACEFVKETDDDSGSEEAEDAASC